MPKKDNPQSQRRFAEAVNPFSSGPLVQEKWTAKIIFRCVPVMKALVGEPLRPDDAAMIDICEYMGRSVLHPFVDRLYLDPKVYNTPPSPGENFRDNLHFKLLKEALITSASNYGSPIRSDGIRAKGDQLRFCCRMKSRIFKSNAVTHRDDGTIIKRRTRTKIYAQALSQDELCKFGFTLKWDSLGFYIDTSHSAGCSYHNGHRPVCPPADAGRGWIERMMEPIHKKTDREVLGLSFRNYFGRSDDDSCQKYWSIYRIIVPDLPESHTTALMDGLSLFSTQNRNELIAIMEKVVAQENAQENELFATMEEVVTQESAQEASDA